MTSSVVPATVSMRQLQYIVAVADAGSFGRAAEQCHVAQPSLSAQVAVAERELGLQLFERSRQGVRLSAAGAAVVVQARRVLGAQRELEALASHLRDPFQGTFRLGIIPTVGPYVLPEIAPALARAHPKLTLVWREDRTTELVREIRDGTLDAGIVALESNIGNLEHARLAWDPFVLAVAPGQPLACSRRPVKLSVLSGARVLLLDDGHCFRTQAWSLCAPLGATEMSFRATSLATLVQMVGAGSSVTLLPSLAVPVENRTQRLCVRPFAPAGPGRTLVLTWRRGAALGAALKDIAGVIRGALPTAARVRGATPPWSRRGREARPTATTAATTRRSGASAPPLTSERLVDEE